VEVRVLSGALVKAPPTAGFFLFSVSSSLNVRRRVGGALDVASLLKGV
jgi:hypothetical protein